MEPVCPKCDSSPSNLELIHDGVKLQLRYCTVCSTTVIVPKEPEQWDREKNR